jgi:carbon monoxide dehydrogenase subunit G
VSGAGTLELVENGGKTTVKYSGDANIRGTMARVGARMVQPAARQIVGQFFGCLESKATQAK